MTERISILAQHGSFRLIECGRGCAVIEARAGQVYSLDRQARRQSEDSEAGMAEVVGDGGWCDRPTAEERFARLVRAGEHFAEKIW